MSALTGDVERLQDVVAANVQEMRELWMLRPDEPCAIVLTIFSVSEHQLNLVTPEDARLLATALSLKPRSDLEDKTLEEVLQLFDVEELPESARVLVVDSMANQVGRVRVSMGEP